MNHAQAFEAAMTERLEREVGRLTVANMAVTIRAELAEHDARLLREQLNHMAATLAEMQAPANTEAEQLAG